ncbi:hypothetical protein [Halapricum desulfuricans]|nr:hypothetical protein [Halapricum desulfuricans]QSG08160.1 hypothetical protein HSR122_0755 [Halapricum desulfuricans]
MIDPDGAETGTEQPPGGDVEIDAGDGRRPDQPGRDDDSPGQDTDDIASEVEPGARRS